MNNVGLPSPVIQLLQQLTPHSDDLKWRVSGGGRKVKLTLTWDWRTPKKATIWRKFQRLINGEVRSRSNPVTPTRPRNIPFIEAAAPLRARSEGEIISIDSNVSFQSPDDSYDQILDGSVVYQCLNACERILNCE
ncbi:unnamed protein product [Dimorphilus gyrociliatus]|uniref:Uncharacterized protein n=1 Tax=Dimorphilus gyrociliatus TaxID=2664684 RepID=A0A7I8VQD4_9ANNE|nr:unnamed protein product [Dimorphilus gyrociliatus]